MTLPEKIVACLLETTYDEYLRGYTPTSGVTGTERRRKIVRACSACEAEHQADKQYPPDVAISHGLCRRHLIDYYVSSLGYTPEQAGRKIDAQGHERPTDWSEPEGAVPPKAAFWATSGGLD